MSMNQSNDDQRSARHAKFRQLVDNLGISQGTLAKYMCLKNTKQSRETVSRKYRGDIGVTPKDLSLLSMLTILKQDGYELDSVSHTEDGEIKVLNKTDSK